MKGAKLWLLILAIVVIPALTVATVNSMTPTGRGAPDYREAKKP